MNLRESIKAYIDGELSEADRLQFESQLNTDDDLQREVQVLESIGSAVKEFGLNQLPRGYWEARERLLPPKRYSARKKWGIAIGSALACLLLVVVFFPVFSQARYASSMRVGLQAERREMFAEGALPQDTLDEDRRVIIRTARVRLEVERVDTAVAQVRDMTAKYNGVIQDTDLRVSMSVPSAEVVTRIPADSFDDFLVELEDLGSLQSATIASADVTTDVLDIEARLRVLRAEEEALLRLLQESRRVPEVVEVRKSLATTRQELESLESRHKHLMRQANFSTARIFLDQRPSLSFAGAPGWFSGTLDSAVVGFFAFSRFLVQVLIWLAIFAPFWGGALVIWWLLRRRGKSKLDSKGH